MPRNAAPETAERAWRELGARVEGWFARRVRDPEVARDLRQETFARLVASIDQLGDDSKLAPWVFRIARGVLVDSWRRDGARRERERTWETPPAEPDGNVNAVVASWLRPMIAALPGADREALELTELEGLTQKQLAGRLGLGPSGARSRVQRARARLTRALEECCTLELDRRGNVIDYEPRSCCREVGRSAGSGPAEAERDRRDAPA